MIHIVMATRGRPHLLERTLTSLASCPRPDTYAGALIVENGEPHGAEEIVQNALPALGATYVFHPDGNKSSALNAALRHIGRGLIIFLDDDVVVGKDLLTAYDDAAKGIESGVFFGGPVFPEYETEPPAWLVDYLPFSARGWTLDGGTTSVTSPSFLGANWAAFVSDMARVGGFDPSFGPGAVTGSVGQERAMQKRLLDAGLAGRYVPDAQVWHWIPRERCSPTWAFHRMFRDGVSRGLHDATESSRILGFPRWAVRRAVAAAVRAVATSVRPKSAENLEAIRQLLLAAGYLKGSRLAHRRAGPQRRQAR